MIEDCVIVGGGVAALSAANYLTDHGIYPLIIDGGKYPTHKICGEFLSHECLPILQQWGIEPTSIVTHVRIIRKGKSIDLQLPKAAGSCSRFILDDKLFKRAVSKGAKSLIETTVVSIRIPEKPEDFFEIELSTGNIIKAKQLMIGMGRIPKMPFIKELQPQYVGLKAHFEGMDMKHFVEMHTFPGGYLGIVNVDQQTSNIACIVKKDLFDAFKKEPKNAFINNLLREKGMERFQERLSNAQMLFDDWLVGYVPEFGIRTHPIWERLYWIGDAAGGIPPISGDGLAIAITSGCLAGEYYLKSNGKAYQKAWIERYKSRFFWARQLHRAMIEPMLNKIGFSIASTIPFLTKKLWQITRE